VSASMIGLRGAAFRTTPYIYCC